MINEKIQKSKKIDNIIIFCLNAESNPTWQVVRQSMINEENSKTKKDKKIKIFCLKAESKPGCHVAERQFAIFVELLRRSWNGSRIQVCYNICRIADDV